jgi:diguanylate cyclase (GGDEF)-like protein
LGQDLLATEDFDALLKETIQTLGERAPADFVGCYLTSRGETLEFRWERDPTLRRFSGRALLSRRAPRGMRLRVVAPDTQLGRRVAKAGLKSATVASVGVGGSRALHLVLAGKSALSVGEEDLGALTTTLALGASRSALQRAATHDPGTGLYNRRYLDIALENELQRAQRFRMAMTLMIVDVDRFKEVNDTYGHAAGDRVLAGVAQEVLATVRTCDIVARYGGDEFVVLLPATNLAGARQLGDRLEERVRALKIESGRQRVQVTLSGGVSAANPRSTPHSLFQAADQLLYEAKRRGRNQIQFPKRRVSELSPQLNLMATPSSPRSAMGSAVSVLEP